MIVDDVLMRKFAATLIDRAIQDAQGLKTNRDGLHGEKERRHARRWLHGHYGRITLDDCVDLLGWDMASIQDRYEWMLSPECVALLRVSKVVREVEA